MKFKPTRKLLPLLKISWLWMLVLNCSWVFAQKSELDTLLKKFDDHRINFPQEKIYVHLDRNLYLTGETLWFKIYCVDGVLHQPANVSKVAYVEIIDTENRPILQTKIALKNGEGNGSVFLPASFNSGNYYLRAYTQWMRNFSPEYFFHKRITVLNSFRKPEPEIEKATAEKPFTATFFPEGGNIVLGLRSKIGFRVTNAEGKGINFTGVIVNQNHDSVTTLKPLKYGIGNFTFTPDAPGNYRAILTDTSGASVTFSLPTIKENGYVLEVKDSTSDLLNVSISTTHPNADAPHVFVFTHARQIISSADVRLLKSGKTSFVLPKKNLAEGISHITVFDHNLRPQCERLYFKPSEKKLSIIAKVNQGEYGVRRKVVLDLSAQNPYDQEVSLSVAIVKTDSLQGDLTGNIFNYLWLSSDLTGNIESPGYYSNTDSQEVRNAVDNLMLTHGWRRFTWDEVLGSKKALAFIPEYRGPLVHGTVLDTKGSPVGGIATYLSTPGKNIQLYTARSKANGEVQFEMKDFWGPRRIIVQTNPEQDSTVRIKINNPYADAFAPLRFPPLRLDPILSKNLLSRSVDMQVQDIYYRDSVKFGLKGIDSTAFYGQPSETYLLDDYTRFTVMEEVMREYVPGVMVRKRKDKFHFLVLDNVRKSLFQNNPLIMLDGMPIFDVDRIMEFDPLKVKKLDVITSRYFLGPFVFPGVVSYSTYTGDLAGFQLDPRAISLNYDGLQRQRLFQSPQYENQKHRESRMPDRRNLMFWNPQVILENDGKKQLEFFTSDLIGKYTIIVEGLSKDGYSGSTTGSFSVKRFNN